MATMLMLFGIVGLLMYRSSEMAHGGGRADARTTETKFDQEGEDASAKKASRTAWVYDEFSTKANADKKEPTPDEDRIDLDKEERRELGREFSVLTDGSISIQPEEMFAYSRLLNWVSNFSYAELASKVVPGWTFHDVMTKPNEWRAELLKLELNVVRILKYEVLDKDTQKSRDLYEVWGWRHDTKSWLYVAVVPELPIGLKPADKMDEQCVLVGYFFKLQGYHEGGAKPNAPALKAPLIVGRLAWKPAPVSAPVKERQFELPGIWLWSLLAVLAFLYLIVRFKMSRGPALATTAVAEADEKKALSWLENAEHGNAVLPNDGPEPDAYDDDFDFENKDRSR
ncbi:MAG: hypothetical protein QM811_31675 [Pirellulales bacterium]